MEERGGLGKQSLTKLKKQKSHPPGLETEFGWGACHWLTWLMIRAVFQAN